MSGLRDTLKGGWHPKGKDGKSSESWRGDFKGVNQVAGWLGKGKDGKSTDAANEHVSRPLSTLKDPSSFGPPPKNVNFHGGAALPNQITPDRGGWGAPLTQEEIQANKEAEDEKVREEEEDKRRAAAPPVPYRVDTTGLSTSHLPPPPKRKDGVDIETPPLVSRQKPGLPESHPISPKPKPGLPPRLPPRQDTNSSQASISPSPSSSSRIAEPPAHKGILNQNSLNRLGAAGVSVPGFGIGGKQPLPSPVKKSTPSRPDTNEAVSPNPNTSASNGVSQLSELQSRFSRLSTNSSSPEPPAQGTTFAQKQAALRTASAFRNNPSSVSITDAKNAASTANNFRERHGEQVASGWQSANSLSQKYGLAEKVGKYSNSASSETTAAPEAVAIPTVEKKFNPAAGKKAPPPPPKKKPGLSSNSEAGAIPPPIPLSSKPKPKATSPQSEQNDLDLDLKSLWFCKSPIVFPPPSVNHLPGSRSSTYTTGWSSNGARKTHFLTGSIRNNQTLVTIKIHLVWDGNEPGLTAKAEQRHLPPPRTLTRRELDEYRDKYCEGIAKWCESKIGQQVGNGECWTLANDALTAVGNDCRAKGGEPCITSQSYVHGALIYSFIPPNPSDPPGGIEAAGVARGDIVQFLSAHLRRKDGMANSYRGAPDHTAVVISVERGGIMRSLEQNVGGVKRVVTEKFDLSEMVAGEVRIFRPVGENWLPPLDTSWP